MVGGIILLEQEPVEFGLKVNYLTSSGEKVRIK